MDTSNPNIHSGHHLVSQKAFKPTSQDDTKLRRFLDRLPLALARTITAPLDFWNTDRNYLDPQIHPDRDFGNNRNKGAQNTKVVHCAQELQHLLEKAYRDDQPICIAAARHSSNGHTLASAGTTQVVLHPARWEAPRWASDHTIEVPACMLWRDVESFAQKQGRSIPVLTAQLGSSVGGTLSVGGGIGCRSVVAGRQIDHVRAVHLILPNGQALWTGPEQNQELFRFVMGGQGTLGVIDRVVLATTSYRPYTTEFRMQFRSLRDAAMAAHAFCSRNDTPESFARLNFVGPLLNTRVVELSLGFEFSSRREAINTRHCPPAGIQALQDRIIKAQVVRDMPHHSHARSSTKLSALTKTSNKHCFYWNDFFFPDIFSYLSFLGHLENTFFAQVGNEYLIKSQGLTFPLHGQKHDFPLSGMQTLPNQRSWSIGLHYAVPESAYASCEFIAAMLVDLQATCHELGGRVYRHGYSEANASQLEKIYGEDYQTLKALKAKLDPHCILNREVLGLSPVK